MEQLIAKTLKKNWIHFGISAALMLGIGLCAIYGIIPKMELIETGTATTVIETVCLIVFMIGIPGSLLWFHKRCGKLCQLEEAELRLRGYAKASLARILFLDFLALATIFLLVFTTMVQAKMFYAMVMIFYFFAIPGKAPLLRDIALNADGSLYVPQAPVEEERKVGNFTVMDEEDDDFIPKNRQDDNARPGEIHSDRFLDD